MQHLPNAYDMSYWIMNSTYGKFWWVETSFGKLVFVMVFITWGLVMIALCLHILEMVRKLVPQKKKKK